MIRDWFRRKNPEPTKSYSSETVQTACELFTGAFFDQGDTVAKAIIDELKDLHPEESPFTLENETCREIFTMEWVLAKLEFWKWFGRSIHDSHLTEQWNLAMESILSEMDAGMASVHEGVMSFREQHQIICDNIVSPAPKKLGPGPTIALAYSTAVKAMSKRDDVPPNLEPALWETTAIALYGDQQCWHFEGHLETALRQTCDQIDAKRSSTPSS